MWYSGPFPVATASEMPMTTVTHDTRVKLMVDLTERSEYRGHSFS